MYSEVAISLAAYTCWETTDDLWIGVLERDRKEFNQLLNLTLDQTYELQLYKLKSHLQDHVIDFLKQFASPGASMHISWKVFSLTKREGIRPQFFGVDVV